MSIMPIAIIWKDGVRYTNQGDVQRWLCKGCGYSFSHWKAPAKPFYTPSSKGSRRQVGAAPRRVKNLVSMNRLKTGLREPQNWPEQTLKESFWSSSNGISQTRDILHTMRFLGHKKIENTLRYIQLEQTLYKESDDYVCKIADTVKEAKELIETGFEYVCEYQDEKLFGKPR